MEVFAPYMHDGRFGTLESVLNHYSSGIVDLARSYFKTKRQTGIALSETEKHN
jgi:cytochrome c peroxidase